MKSAKTAAVLLAAILLLSSCAGRGGEESFSEQTTGNSPATETSAGDASASLTSATLPPSARSREEAEGIFRSARPAAEILAAAETMGQFWFFYTEGEPAVPWPDIRLDCYGKTGALLAENILCGGEESRIYAFGTHTEYSDVLPVYLSFPYLQNEAARGLAAFPQRWYVRLTDREIKLSGGAGDGLFIPLALGEFYIGTPGVQAEMQGCRAGFDGVSFLFAPVSGEGFDGGEALPLTLAEYDSAAHRLILRMKNTSVGEFAPPEGNAFIKSVSVERDGFDAVAVIALTEIAGAYTPGVRTYLPSPESATRMGIAEWRFGADGGFVQKLPAGEE